MSQLDQVLANIDADLDASARTAVRVAAGSRRSPPIRPTRTIAAAPAEWLRDELDGFGFDGLACARRGGHPVVVGHAKGGRKPHVLFYGHYDVQPVDPLDLWETPPFEPQIATLPDGRKVISARGACDDKGQVMTFVEACRAWKAVTGSLPIGITFLVEGAEEDGSKFLPEFVEANKDELQGRRRRSSATPACGTRTRRRSPRRCAAWSTRRSSCAAPTATCIRACSAARRATRSMCCAKIIADLHDDERPHHDPGFLRRRAGDADAGARAVAEAQPHARRISSARSACKIPAGEKGRMLIEQIQSRPTCDVNGIIGGYTGEGTKTVIAGEARAKISFRLVGDQDPEKISRGLPGASCASASRPIARSSSSGTRARGRSSCPTTCRR